MLLLVAIWGFAEATLFFIVADVPISAVGLRYGWSKAWRGSLVAALAAAAGGQVLFHWSAAAPAEVRHLLLRVPGIGPELLDGAFAAHLHGGFEAMASGAFRGVPYKLYAAAAGAEGAPAASFFIGSIAARLPRFLLVAALSSWLGPRLRGVLGPGAVAALFICGWSGFYAFYFAAMGH